MLIYKTIYIDFPSAEELEIFISRLNNAKAELQKERYENFILSVEYDYAESPCGIQIIGSREETEAGIKAKLAKSLIQEEYIKRHEIALLKELMQKYPDNHSN